MSFGLYYIASMIANYFNARVDQLLIGMLLGPQALGYYRVVIQLTAQVIQKINPAVTRVAFPVLSWIQHDALKLKSGYLHRHRCLGTCLRLL